MVDVVVVSDSVPASASGEASEVESSPVDVSVAVEVLLGAVLSSSVDVVVLEFSVVSVASASSLVAVLVGVGSGSDVSGLTVVGCNGATPDVEVLVVGATVTVEPVLVPVLVVVSAVSGVDVPPPAQLSRDREQATAMDVSLIIGCSVADIRTWVVQRADERA